MRYLMFLLLFCSVAQAQEQKPLSTVIPITEQRRPATIPKPYGTPTKWKLLRSSTAPAGEKGESVWLFTFGRKPLVKPKFPLDDLPLVEATIIVAQPLQQKGRWQILRRVPLGLSRKEFVNEWRIRWLHPATSSGPVLIMRRDLENFLGNYELMVFPMGWQQKTAVRQTFKNWSGVNQSAQFIFDSVDTNGNLMPIESIVNYERGDTVKTVKGKDNLWLWNGNGWTDPQ